MAKINKKNTAAKTEKKPDLKAVPPAAKKTEPKVEKAAVVEEPEEDGDEEEEGEAPETEGKAKSKRSAGHRGSAFDRARGLTARSNAAVLKASNTVTAIKAKLDAEEGAAFATEIGEASEALTEASNWLTIAVAKLSAVPEGHKFPSVRTTRVNTSIVVGAKVTFREKKEELWPIFEKGEDKVMTVASIIGDGKRVLCKLASGGRQVLPTAHLKVAGQTETEEADEAAAS